MDAVRKIQREGRASTFKNKLNEAIEHGKEWEGRDISYYYLNKNIEEQKIINENKKVYLRK